MTDHDPIDELLGGLRTDVPEMSDKAFAVGRARLQTLVAPASVTSAPEQIQKVTPLRKRRLLRSPPGKLIATAAAAVVLAVGVVAGQAVWSGDNAPTASAAEQLRTAAENATDEKPKPGQYLYTTTHTWEMGLFSPRSAEQPEKSGSSPEKRLVYLQETVREEWAPVDPAEQECQGRTTITGNRKWLVGSEEEAKAAGFKEPKKKVTEGSGYCGSGLLELSSDPREVYNEFINGRFAVEGKPDAAMVANITNVLNTGLLADNRAVLFKVLAMMPGIKVTEQFANVDGRKGTAYGLSEGGDRRDVVIDSATGEYIGERWIVEDGEIDDLPIPKDTVVRYTSVTGPVIVNKSGATS